MARQFTNVPEYAFSRVLILTSIFLTASYMLFRTLARSQANPLRRLSQMAQNLSDGAINGRSNGTSTGVSLADLPKSNVFTSNLPGDEKFPTPAESYKSTREELGPRMVKGALYTYVRPEERQDPELYGAGTRALSDIGLRREEAETEDFRKLVSGNKMMWNPENEEGIYPWAQCYGGERMGSPTRFLD